MRAQVPADSENMRSEMSTRTPFVLNGWLILVTGLLVICLGGSGGLYSLLVAAPLFIFANGFMFIKALWQREYQLAILYIVVVAGAAVLCYAIGAPGKIGG